MNFKGKAIPTNPVKKDLSVVDLVDNYFNAYNSARLSEICRLMAEKMFKDDVTVGMTLTGALTPAGLGSTAMVPLIENGFVDYIVITGANLYHDMHFGLGYKLYQSSPFLDDQELQKEKLVRIYDILMSDDVLENTNQYIRDLVCQPEFQKKMPSSELHYLLGKQMAKTEKASGESSATMLAAAYKHGIPIYTPSPCDSAIGLDIAEKKFNGIKTDYDVMRDVNEITAIALMAKRTCKSGVFIIGGGSPKNFIMQTIPQLNDLLNEHVEGHDYFIQITDARADTGGLSGATPSEAVSWGKVNPCMLPHSIVSYTDATIALPIITSYLLSRCAPRKSKRLYDQRDKLLDDLKKSLKK